LNESQATALLGFGSPDKTGGFGLSGGLTRLNMDARAPTLGGQARGYVEVDFKGSSDFQMRHAYFSLTTAKGKLLTGQYWSSAMVLWALPESVVEPIVSGAMFARQAQISWEQPFAQNLVYSVEYLAAGGDCAGSDTRTARATVARFARKCFWFRWSI